MDNTKALVGAAMAGCVAATLGAADLNEYKQPKERVEHPVLAIIADAKTPLIALFTFLSTGPGIAVGVLEAQKRTRERADLVVRYLQHVHLRSFPYDQTGMSEDHRVSLFTVKQERDKTLRWGWPPYHKKKPTLVCVHRTDRTAPTIKWEIAKREGLVVKAWILQASITVDPPNGQPSDEERYRKESAMTEETQKNRSWQRAGMHALPLITGATDPLAVLLVESKTSSVACSELIWDARTMAMLLGEKS